MEGGTFDDTFDPSTYEEMGDADDTTFDPSTYDEMGDDDNTTFDPSAYDEMGDDDNTTFDPSAYDEMGDDDAIDGNDDDYEGIEGALKQYGPVITGGGGNGPNYANTADGIDVLHLQDGQESSDNSAANNGAMAYGAVQAKKGGREGKQKQKAPVAVQNPTSDSAREKVANGGGGFKRKPSVYLGFGSEEDGIKAIPKGNVLARRQAFTEANC